MLICNQGRIRSPTQELINAVVYLIIRLLNQIKLFFFRGLAAPNGPGSLYYRDFTIKVINSKVSRTSLDE
jgi:hypothetical protein